MYSALVYRLLFIILTLTVIPSIDRLGFNHSYCSFRVIVSFVDIGSTWTLMWCTFANIHTGIIGVIDVITSNHWCYSSLAQNGFPVVINNSSNWALIKSNTILLRCQRRFWPCSIKNFLYLSILVRRSWINITITLRKQSMTTYSVERSSEQQKAS